MKYVETESVWNACMEAIDELDFSKIHIPYEENCETISKTTLANGEGGKDCKQSYFYTYDKVFLSLGKNYK